ncbi:hypothetical protein GCM10011507_33300 [Edaphobacter acidisoli]|uniref:DUF4157 domain-containing protein n=2 Tax=Edaphobacter acidisoli TaxID=2040573 RepID=A0A916S0T0_9BACT|nr:hypothetical protein GCM10011507_33300 [Edaphobacter acidisoli]
MVLAIAMLLVAGSVACVGQTATAPSDSQTPAAKAESDKPMTKEQAKELFKSVDDILNFVSTDSKLPIEHSVKRKLITRDEVNRYLTKKFNDDKSAKHMERDEIVLKKFGLLDQDFQLRPFLLSLLTEQIAGFYDNKTKTVNLLDWIKPDDQKPVLAHELTHALQDQKVDLTKWSDVGEDNIARNVKEDNQHLQTDEAETARSAVAEGQAMAVFVDYSLRPTGKTIADTPGIGERLKDLAADTSGSPIMARAPLLLQQSLIFPYSDGLAFEQAIMVKKGREAAFAGTLANPPSSSFEIMNPAAYMAHTPVPVLRMPDIHPLIDAEYTPYDVGVMGELDVRILTELFGGKEVSDALTPEWDGGLYYAAQRKSAMTDGQKDSTASLALLYYSQWKSEDAARAFLRVYTRELPRKYTRVELSKKDAQSADEQVYSTNEGDVLLSVSGKDVFISEGFELPLARKLRDAIQSVQGTGPLQVAGVRMHEPSLSMAEMLGSFGMMRVGLERYTLKGAGAGSGITSVY